MINIPAYWHNFIDGDYCDGGAGRLTVLDPASGEPLAEQALADREDVSRAVAAAKALSDGGSWSGLRPVERAAPSISSLASHSGFPASRVRMGAISSMRSSM